MKKYSGKIAKGDFEITDQTKLFVSKLNLENVDLFTKYIGADSWNYLHDIFRDVVYAIPKTENNGSVCVFGNFNHLKETYEVVNNDINYLKAKEVVAIDLFKEGKITRPECLRHEVDLMLNEDSGAIKILTQSGESL